jgi:hypothetical protein
MRYPELGLTIPDAVMVIGKYVYACFNPNLEQSIADFARPWYTMDDEEHVMEAFEAMDIDYDKMNVGMPIDWVDYTLIPPLERKK